MAEKMSERNKAVILLRSWCRRFLALLTVPLLLLGLVLPVSVGAVAYDYDDLPHTVTVDGANDIVTVTLDPSKGSWSYFYPVSGYTAGDTVVFPESTEYWQAQYNYFDYGSGIDPSNIPDGTVFQTVLSSTWDEQLPNGSLNPRYELVLRNIGDKSVTLGQIIGSPVVGTGINDTVTLTCTYHAITGTAYLFPLVTLGNFSTDYPMTVKVVSCTLTMSISSLYRQQQLTGKTNALLTEVSQQLEANGQKLDDVLAQQQANGEKLDGVNDKLEQNGEKLDEIAKHPEQEKQEANGSGNDAVDSIMSGVPDHGKEFQTAIKQFAASASYNGTEAKLHTPAVKMPEIPGLVPSVTIMEPQEVDFGEYIKIIPTPLLTLVQSLLTAALIIYCFKELYDTIQYVLTLKGGGGQ